MQSTRRCLFQIDPTHSSIQLGLTCTFRASLSWAHPPVINYVVCGRLVVSSNPVSEREEDVVALHQHIGSLKTWSGLEVVPRCEPSTYQPISWWHSHCAIGSSLSHSLSHCSIYHTNSCWIHHSQSSLMIQWLNHWPMAW